MPKTKVERLRNNKAWSRMHLAFAAGTSERTIYNIETAEVRRPNRKATQESIAKALGTTVEVLFTTTGRAR